MKVIVALLPLLLVLKSNSVKWSPFEGICRMRQVA